MVPAGPGGAKEQLGMWWKSHGKYHHQKCGMQMKEMTRQTGMVVTGGGDRQPTQAQTQQHLTVDDIPHPGELVANRNEICRQARARASL